MTALLLDFGNTRCKYAYATSNGLSEVSARAYGGENSPLALLDGMGLGTGFVRCLAASVKESVFNERFGKAVSQKFGIEVEWLFTHERDDLTLAYADITTFGVDRFLNLLGAQSLALDKAIVVSAGTAVTVDGLLAGRHLGGSILPGLGLLSNVLSQNTSLISDLADPAHVNVFGASTKEAVSGGVLNGYVGAAVYVVQEMKRQMPADTLVVVTGGDAVRVSSAFDFPYVIENGLLFKGMIRLL